MDYLQRFFQTLMKFICPFFLLVFLSVNAQDKNYPTSNKKEEIIDKGIKAFFKKDVYETKASSIKLLELYKLDKDSATLAKHYHYKALYNKLMYIEDSCFYYYHKSKNISKLIGDSIETGRRLLSIALLQRESKDFLGSEISTIEALQYLEPIKSITFLERAYNNLGLVSAELHQNETALNYYNKALDNDKLLKHDSGYFLSIMNNIGLLYQTNNKNQIAIDYFKKGLKYDSIRYKFPRRYAALLENLAASNFLLGNKKDVLKQYNIVLKVSDSLKNFERLSTTHLNVADFYLSEKRLQKAKYHAHEALKYAKQTHNNKRWLEALHLLSNLTTGSRSKQYLKEYIYLNDSLIQKERRLKNQFAKIRYETDKKEKENSLLKIENEKNETEIVYHKQQKTIGWLLFIVSLLALGSSVLFFVVRRKRLIYQNQLQKAQAREKERQQIAKSLHDEVAGDLRLLHQKLQKSLLLEEAQKLNEVKDNVRNLSHKLSSVSFKKVTFKDQVINLVSDYFEANFKIIVTGINDQQWQIINTTIKRLLYLSIRESIQNCKKYAKASKMTIHFSIHKKNVFLSIEDNGIGFDTNATKKGIGLLNLEERLEELNGTLTIDSEPNNGTKTYIQIPLNA